MIKIINITNDPIQRHTIATDARDVILRLYFIATVQSWFIDVQYGDLAVYGVRLVIGARHLPSAGMPLDFIVGDNLNLGIDPFSIDDFQNERVSLYMLEASDMEEIRGQPVPL